MDQRVPDPLHRVRCGCGGRYGGTDNCGTTSTTRMSRLGCSAWAAVLVASLPGATPLVPALSPVRLDGAPRMRAPGGSCLAMCGGAPRRVPHHDVTVRPLPPWMPVEQLLGSGEWRLEEEVQVYGTKLIASCSLARDDACWLAARIRGLGFGGQKLEFSAAPPLPRTAVRTARTEEARARRDTSPGFKKKGVKLDDVGKFSLTPEQLAIQLAEDSRVRGRRVIDATCGAGGNAIAFARSGCQVVAIERDKPRLELARHNARIYGVADRIEFVHGDSCKLVPDMKADILFLDPPWGQDYDKVSTKLDSLPLLQKMLDSIAVNGCSFDRVLAKVPPSFDPASTPQAHPEAWFGHAQGDKHRIKFLILDFPKAIS